MTSATLCPYPSRRSLVRPSPPAPVSARPPASFHYHGIKRAARINWLAVLISIGLHAALLHDFYGRPAPKKHVAVVEDAPALLMLPDTKEPEEDTPKELNDADAVPSVQVPTLQDIPMLVPIDAGFTQLLDPTVPMKLEGAAGIVAIPLNIQHGRGNGGLKNIFNVADLDRQPEPIVQTPPTFPFDLKRSSTEGSVVAEFIITSAGETAAPLIVSSSNPGFERAALEAIAKWRFKPGMKAGRKVNTRVRQVITFTVLE